MIIQILKDDGVKEETIKKNRRLTKIVNLLKQPNKIEGLAPLFLTLILSRARKKGKGDLNKRNK